MEKGWFLQQMVLEQLGIHMQNNESSHRPYTLHNNSFKMDHRHKYKMKTIELLEEKI